MPILAHNPDGLFPRYRSYSHTIEIQGESRLLVISDLNGYLADGVTMPDSFEEQRDLIWTHLGTILRGRHGLPQPDLRADLVGGPRV